MAGSRQSYYNTYQAYFFLAHPMKRVKIEEKLLWKAYRKSPTFFRTVPSQTPYGRLFPKIGGSQPHPRTAITIISGTGEATDFKFGQNIRTVHPNKSPLKILEKRERGRLQGLPKVLKYSLLSQEWVKWRTSNFVCTIAGLIGTKAPVSPTPGQYCGCG